jgi:molybdate transport system permease protein
MTMPSEGQSKAQQVHRVGSDLPFLIGLGILGGSYVLIIVLMVLADVAYTDRDSLVAALNSKEIRFSIMLSLVTCCISTILSVWVAVPIGYLMSRFHFRGKNLVDALLDIPIVLPPLVIGISLLILFNFPPFKWFSEAVVFEVPAIIIAQFMVAAAFAVRTMRVTFDQIPARYEDVAMTLGCNRSQAFWQVILPQAKRGLLAAGTIAWARSLGEFGPILVFAGSTRLRTEVLPTSVYLEMQAGNLKGMLAVAIIMVAAAAVVLVLARLLGMKKLNA